MSYILEALKKAEQQREIGQVPGIDSKHEPALAGLSSRWVMIVGLVLLVNAGLLVILFWPQAQTVVSEQAARSQVVPPGSEAAPVRETQPPPSAKAVPVTPTVTPPVIPPVVAPSAVVPEAALTVIPSVAAPSVTPSLAAPPGVPVAPVAATPQAAPEHVSPPAPAPSPAPLQRARDIPVWPQVPMHIFQRLPNGLKIDVHVYSEYPENRFVLINLQKYREGEQLQEGPVLDEITAEGIVFSLQGQQFLVQAK